MDTSNREKIVLWKPSGGLGHCLRNLAWCLDECLRLKYKLYIYGFNTHIPFQYDAFEFLEFLKNKDVTELKNEDEFNNFCTKYKISDAGKKLIDTAGYKTGQKIINKDNPSVTIICSTWQKNTTGLLNFKKSFIQSILNNPYKYYKNDYTLLENTNDNNYTFHIMGSYTKALGILNKDLEITSDDKEYIKKKKKLCINYTKRDKTKHYLECLEHSEHTIPNIMSIDKATYGIKDKTIDVTNIVRKKLCDNINETNIVMGFEISGSYYKNLNVSNKDLGITENDTEYYNKPKTLIIKYKNSYGITNEIKIIEKEECKIDNISKILKASYGINDKQIDVTSKVKSMCKSKTTKILSNTDIKNQQEKIKTITTKEKYIAVHFRYRDKKVEGGYIKKLSEIKKTIKKSGIKNIFVATDSPMFFNYLKDKLSDVTIFRYTNPPEHGLNIHYNKDVFTKGENFYKTMLDVYMCKNASHFIPSDKSGFSNIVKEVNSIL
jgi:tetratricopeptide (TPR) repeat protein